MKDALPGQQPHYRRLPTLGERRHRGFRYAVPLTAALVVAGGAAFVPQVRSKVTDTAHGIIQGRSSSSFTEGVRIEELLPPTFYIHEGTITVDASKATYRYLPEDTVSDDLFTPFHYQPARTDAGAAWYQVLRLDGVKISPNPNKGSEEVILEYTNPIVILGGHPGYPGNPRMHAFWILNPNSVIRGANTSGPFKKVLGLSIESNAMKGVVDGASEDRIVEVNLVAPGVYRKPDGTIIQQKSINQLKIKPKPTSKP